MHTILKHPLIDNKMAMLRSKDTGTKEFKELVDEISMLLTFEFSRNFETTKKTIETPLEKMEANVLASEVVIVPILRAGLGMVDGVRRIIPTAKVGHIGLYRNEETLEPVQYYFKLPKFNEHTVFILVDPMLATGNSAIKGIDLLKEAGCKNIIYAGLVGCPTGIEAFEKAHPDVPIYLASCDRCLNENGYILPGLGDCGDRLFGTK